MKKGNATKLISEGNEHYRKGEMAEAIKSYNQALQMDPENPVAWNNKGLILAVAGNYEEALKCHMKALEFDRNHVDSISNVGMAFTKLGDFDKALKWYDKALSIDPNHETTWNNKGNLLSKMGLFEESLACYDRALEINPNYMAAMNNKAVELIHLKRYGEALALLNAVLRARPLFAEGWYVKGKAYIGMGEFDKAMVCLERAHRLSPDFLQAKTALDILKKRLVEPPGKKAMGDGKKKKIVTESQQIILEKSIQKDILTPRSDAERMGDEFERQDERLSIDERVLLGCMADEPMTAAELKQEMGGKIGKPAFDRALEGLVKKGLAVREDGRDGPAYARSELLGSIEEEMIEDREEVADDTANDLHAMMSRGKKLIAAGRFKEAADMLRKVMKINPYDDEAICLMAQVQYGMGDRDRAINTISRILSREPDNVSAWLTLARAALKAGDHSDSAECFRKVLELQPGNLEAREGLAECEKALR